MAISRAAGRAAFYDAFRRTLLDPDGPAARHAREFEDRVRSSDMRYAGEPLDVAYFPVAIAPGDLDFLGRTVERALAILERLTAAVLRAPGLAERHFGWDERRLRVVRHDPGYPLAIPCARFDSYWDGAEGLRFLEVNTDGTSGMTNVERVTAFFLESEGVRALPFRLENFDLRARVLETLLECYAAWRAGSARPERSRRAAEPRIAIVDWRTVKTSAEFRAFVRFFEDRGLRATIADPRDLRFDGERLLDRGGLPIDLIYRRVVSTEYFAAPPEDTAAMTEAYLAGRVCVAGSFRSDAAFDKRAIALLTSPDLAEEYADLANERSFMDERFARTWVLRPGEVLERARAERERLVLKPAALYEGRGVKIGVETDAAAWGAALEEAAARGDHVLQERIVPPELTVELERDGRFVSRPLYLSLGEYAFGGKLIGFNARVASTLVLSADDDERLLPVVKLLPPGSGLQAPGSGWPPEA